MSTAGPTIDPIAPCNVHGCPEPPVLALDRRNFCGRHLHELLGQDVTTHEATALLASGCATTPVKVSQHAEGHLSPEGLRQLSSEED